jgi:N-acetylneuraminic acid mutarotase
MFYKYFPAALCLSTIIILSCQKEIPLSTPPTSANKPTKTTDDLVVGPPTVTSWLRGPGLPAALPKITGRSDAFGFAIGGKGYMGSGILLDSFHNQIPATDFWSWDTVTATWSQQADFPGTARGDAATFVAAGKGYVCTGNNWLGAATRSSKENWQFDPAANSWTRKKNFPGPARLSAVGASVDDLGYVGTGQSAAGDAMGFNDWYQYDPTTDSWTRKADLPAQYRWAAIAFASRNKVFVGTGTNYDHGNFGDNWAYDPATDSWKSRAACPGGPRAYATGLSIPNEGVMLAGQGGLFTGTECWIYNFSNNTWTSSLKVPGSRFDAGGFAIGGAVFIFGGDGSNGNYDEKNDFWGLRLE